MRFDDLESLPPKMREQAKRKLAGNAGKSPVDGTKRNKYGNKKTVVDGIPFDSQKEGNRFSLLRDMEDMGLIRELRLQQEFTLQEAYTTSGGQRVRAIRYRADFAYRREEPDGTTIYIVEDVKSRATKTRVYAIKKKLMMEKFGIEITEV